MSLGEINGYREYRECPVEKNGKARIAQVAPAVFQKVANTPSFRELFNRARQDDSEACYALYLCYRTNRVAFARIQFDKALELGHPKILKMMQQQTGPKPTKTSPYWICKVIKRAEANDPQACYQLYHYFAYFDDSLALDWLDRADELNYLPAIIDKGGKIGTGIKYVKNPTLAELYLLRAKVLQPS